MLISNLDLLATASGGVARLRELILTLAVQGKLVPQNPNDEPTSELLKRIRAEKDRLIAEGRIKRDKPLPPIAEDELPFKLPRGWNCARLDELSIFVVDCPHSTAKFVSKGLLCIDTNSFKEGALLPQKLRYVDEATFVERIARLQPEPGDLVFSREGSVGESIIIPEGVVACLGQRVMLFRFSKSISNELVRLVITSKGFLDKLLTLHKGIGAKHVNVRDMRLAVVPVPPIAEQSRIVTRVEELMRLCDALEAKGQLEATQHAQLVSTLLSTLTESETPEELAENWQRIATHFGLLLDRPEAVDVLEQTILQLAVRGLLVPQDPRDEPASELLRKIRAEKDKLIAEGKNKRDKLLPPIADNSSPCALPIGWAWMRFAELGHFCGGKTPSTHRSTYWDGDIPWITPKDMKQPLLSDSEDKVTHLALADGLTLIPMQSVLMVVRSGILRRTLPTAINNVETTINQDLKALVLVRPALAAYVQLLICGFEGFILKNLTKVGTTVESMQFDEFTAQPFPLPPLVEQTRIVTRVAQLRRLCADLRQRLTASQSTQALLAEALIADLPT